MSTDFSIRPVGTPAPAPPIQPSSPTVIAATPTVLPPSQSVTAADTSSSAGNDQSSAANDVYISHQAFFDRTAGTMVFQVVNGRTDEVVDQYPDEAVLRRRAYFRALDAQKSDVPHIVATDRTA